MINFDKIKDGMYILKDKESLDIISDHVKNIMNAASNGKSSIYHDTINSILYENILSRYVSSIFIETNKDILNKEHHILISLTIDNNSYNITIGTFDLEDKTKYINGITEV